MAIPDLQKVIAYYPEFPNGVHPACLAVPSIDEESFADMVEDIRENGLLEDLVRRDGMLIDGRTRLLACYEANTDIRVKDHNGVADVWTLVNEWNILRRHLTVGQKAMYGERWEEEEKEKAKQRHRDAVALSNKSRKKESLMCEVPYPDTCPDMDSKQDSRDSIGRRVGVSGKSIDRARTVRLHAPDLAKKVTDGSLELNTAYREAAARKKQKESQVPVAEKPAAIKLPETVPILTHLGEKKQIAAPKKPVFNRTNDSVDWASWTWNPVTGCLHGCEFCYAREIAMSERMKPYYPNGFEPTLHEYRLAAPANTNRPVSDDAADGRVFVCSMADLFGKWVPNEWIRKVFDACLGSPEWQYMFLTKWPARYSQMPLIERAWYGASVIQQSDVSRVEKAMQKIEGNCTRWISLEPMLQPIVFNDLSWCDLVVIGAQTVTTQPGGKVVPAFAPEFDWVVDVVNQCREFGVPYYLKANLGLQQPGMKLPKPMPRGVK